MLTKIKNFLRWSFGLLFVFMLFFQPSGFAVLATIALLILAALLIPPSYELIAKHGLGKIPASLRKVAVIAAVFVSIYLIGGETGRQSEQQEARELAEAKLLEEALRNLESEYNRYLSAQDKISALEELSFKTDFSSIEDIKTCLEDGNCFSNLRGKKVLMDIEGNYGWSDNILESSAFYTDFVSQKKERIGINLTMRNAVTHGDERRKGIKLTTPSGLQTLDVPETDSAVFKVLAIFEESRGFGYMQPLNGYIIEAQVDQDKYITAVADYEEWLNEEREDEREREIAERASPNIVAQGEPARQSSVQSGVTTNAMLPGISTAAQWSDWQDAGGLQLDETWIRYGVKEASARYKDETLSTLVLHLHGSARTAIGQVTPSVNNLRIDLSRWCGTEWDVFGEGNAARIAETTEWACEIILDYQGSGPLVSIRSRNQ